MNKIHGSTDINKTEEAFIELKRSVYAALENYSNVHRGSGHNSMITTYLYEEARNIVLGYLVPDRKKYTVIFCTPERADIFSAQLKDDDYKRVSSQEIGLPLGVVAMAVVKTALPAGIPFQTGGGTTRLVSRDWVIWADCPARFEAGTPAIINVITFARALQIEAQTERGVFRNSAARKLSAPDIIYHDELEKFSGKRMLEELRKTLIGSGMNVPTSEGLRSYINLDNAASTPSFLPIWNAFCSTCMQPVEMQQQIVREVRSICAEFLGAPERDYEILFASNTTEAINLVAESLGNESDKETEPVILNTILEHNSNDLPWRMIPDCSVVRLGADDEGFIDLDELNKVLESYNQKNEHGKKRIRLVAVSGASNVLGVFNDIAAISSAAHWYGARLLVDAAQLIAHRRVSVEDSGIDYLAFSGHKVYAPFGCGVLVTAKGLLSFTRDRLAAVRSSGDDNSAGIAALGKSIMLLNRIGFDVIREEEQILTHLLLKGLAGVPGITIHGIKDPDSPAFAKKGGVVVFSLKGMMPDSVAKELAARSGIGVRYGCHCAHLLVKRLLNVPPFLENFQRLIATFFPHLVFPGVTRVSLGIQNQKEDIDAIIGSLHLITSRQKHSTGKEIKKQINDFVLTRARKVFYSAQTG